MAKTKEIVFHRPYAGNVLFPSELPGIERVLCATLLGVWLQADIGMRKQVDYICNQRTYLLTQLKRQGLPQMRDELHWLPIRQRIEYKLCLTVFKALHGISSGYIAAMCVPVSSLALWSRLRSANLGTLFFIRMNTEF